MIKKILISLFILILALIPTFFYLKNNNGNISVSRTFDAPVDKVWQLWASPDAISKWWSPKDFTAPVIKSDFFNGGTFLFSMKDPSGKMFWNAGKYLQINQHKRIVESMTFSDENGKVVPASTYGLPGLWPDEVVVMIDFKEENGKTNLRVQETGIPLIMHLFAKMGWQQQFDKMEVLLK